MPSQNGQTPGVLAHKAAVADLLERNKKYSETYKAPPALKDGIIKAVNAGRRTTVVKLATISNAGGRTADAVRSILALDALGNLGTVMIVHHTDCGMTHFTGAEFQQKTAERHPDLAKPDMQFGEVSDPHKTILEDMRHLKGFKSFEDNGTEIRGFVLDLKTGRMTEAKL
ncbi:hypothetical protein LTR65_008478 [Meristemomyces frigidus]